MKLETKYIRKGSKLIAKLMGGKFIKKIGNCTYNEYHFETPIIGSVGMEYDKYSDAYLVFNTLTQCSLNDMEYHLSWNWLMPVVKKIGEVMEKGENDDKVPAMFFHYLTDGEIEKTFKGVVDFLEQYYES